MRAGGRAGGWAGGQATHLDCGRRWVSAHARYVHHELEVRRGRVYGHATLLHPPPADHLHADHTQRGVDLAAVVHTDVGALRGCSWSGALEAVEEGVTSQEVLYLA